MTVRHLILPLLLVCSSVSAQSFSGWRSYSSAKFYAEEDSVVPGQKLTIALDVQLVKPWHTYWINPGDSGSAVKLRLTSNEGQEMLTGPILFPVPHRLESGPVVSFVYDNEVMFLADVIIPQSLKVGDQLKLRLDAEWLVCAEVCIPANDSFDLKLPVRLVGDVKPSAQSAKFEQWRSRMPRLQTTVVGDKRGEHAELTFNKPAEFAKFRFVDFFPLRGSHLGNGKAKVIEESNSTLKLQVPLRAVGERRADLVGLVVVKHGLRTAGLQWGDPSYGFVSEQPNVRAQTKAPIQSLSVILLFAFLGGLILNLMPCVFPILSMKLLSLVKQVDHHPKTVQLQNLAYVTGVIVSFLILGGGLAAVRNAGVLVGWGFQLQSPSFLIVLIWLFFLLGVQLFGYFEFEWLNPNLGGSLARKDGPAGSFFTGVLAVVVASPCTAPFMGAALGFALSQSVVVLLLVFFAMGLGLAFPYLAFAVFPGVVRWLPRPGAWMQTVKEVMAFPLLLTCIWLIWLLAQVKGNAASAVALVSLTGLFMSLWLRKKSPRLAMVFAALLAAGTSSLIHRLPVVDATARAQDFGLKWQPFSDDSLHRADDETVFVNFTADWCLTCKVNERLVFQDPSVIEWLHEKRVRMVMGDWTRQDARITEFLNKHQRAGVPFYIAFGPGAPQGKILPELLTPDVFKENLFTVINGGTTK